MSKSIKPIQLDKAIEETLTVYGEGVIERVNEAGRASMDKLVKLTRKTAPRGKRNSKNFARSITSTEVKSGRGNKYIWHVKAPNYRLTHLLVHGHATKDGGRTKADPFLKDALDQVLPEYEHAVEEAVKND